ncbi:agmatinase [Thiomonas sp.]|uniref:agmatinase n=1 Tax=Thiomonas sp. TaxID=2047785 RepID=UPI0026161588|nr:agmatinase [Thiomonas sp.]
MVQHAFAYVSPRRFAGAAACSGAQPAAAFGVAGVAWDGAVTNRPGARFGPAAIRQASLMLCDATHPLFDVSPVDQLCDHGDLLLPNTSLQAMRAALEPQAQRLMAQQHMVWLGGDHSITLSLLRALRAVHGQPLAVLHFDAHCDTWSDHFGEPSGHGTWVVEAVQEGLVVPQGMVQVGIRSAAERAARDYVNRIGGRVFTARELRGLESPSQLAPVVADIRARLAASAAPVYLTLDIDCLDPAFAPGTGTPEPGGLSSAQVLSLLEELCAMQLPFVGMDCVEVAPPYDHAELTANIAAHCVWTYVCARMAAARCAQA